MIDPNFTTEIIKSILLVITSVIIGVISGYLTYRYKVKNENTSVNRDRLLKNIAKIEDFLNMKVEDSFLGQDMARLNEVIHALEENDESNTKEIAWISDEISFVSDEMHNDKIDKTKKEVLLAKLKSLELRLSDKREDIKKARKKLGEITLELDKLRIQVDEGRKRLINDDIGATGLTVDSSGKLAKLLLELTEIASDKNRKYFSDPRAMTIRSEINHFFDELIRKTG